MKPVSLQTDEDEMKLRMFLILAIFAGCNIDSSDSGDNLSSVTTLQFTKRISVENDGIANVGSICYLQNGDLAVLDNIAKIIHIYRDGVHFTEINAQGEGPLEYTSPVEISALNDGGFLLTCSSDQKILIFNASYSCVDAINFAGCNLRPGTPVRVEVISDDMIIGKNYFYRDLNECGTEVSIWDVSSPDDPARERIIRMRNAASFHPIEYIMNTSIVFDAQMSSGEICVADVCTDSYEISFLSTSDSLLHTYTDSEQLAVRKSEEELAAETTRIREAWIRGTGSDAGFQYDPNVDNFIVLNLDYSTDGRLWVRKNSPFSMAYDVLDENYEKIAEYEFQLPDQQMNDGWHVAIGDSMIAAAPVNPEMEQIIYTMYMP